MTTLRAVLCVLMFSCLLVAGGLAGEVTPQTDLVGWWSGPAPPTSGGTSPDAPGLMHDGVVEGSANCAPRIVVKAFRLDDANGSGRYVGVPQNLSLELAARRRLPGPVASRDAQTSSQRLERHSHRRGRTSVLASAGAFKYFCERGGRST